MNSNRENEKDIKIDDIEIDHEFELEEKKVNSLDLEEIKKTRNKEKLEYNRNESSDRNNSKGFQDVEHRHDRNSQDNNQDDIEQIQKFKVPLSLKKTFICSSVLFIVGITLIILGFIEEIAEADPGKGITFWVLGGIILIPGGYYSYQFYKARRAKSYDERQEILDEIPEL